MGKKARVPVDSFHRPWLTQFHQERGFDRAGSRGRPTNACSYEDTKPAAPQQSVNKEAVKISG